MSTQDLKIGSILFSEMPYASVLLPEHYLTHCHHCYIPLISPVPCLKCTQCRYCSDTVNINMSIILYTLKVFHSGDGRYGAISTLQCRQESWKIYHQYECTSLDLLHSIGIAHLSIRTIFVAGMKSLMSYKSTMERLKDQKG